MKKVLLTALMAIAAITVSAQIPSVNLEDVKGAQYNTKNIVKAGVPTIISFWSTSCKPCKMELDAIYEAFPDWEEEAEFQVVAVSTDDNRLLSKAKSLAEGHGWGETFTLLFDKNQDFMRAMNVTQVPHVFVLDAKGKVIYSHTSYLPGNENDLFEKIKACK